MIGAGLEDAIIERYFTDSRHRKGPDIICSMDPAELKFLIDRSKEIAMALGNSKRRTKPEDDVYSSARGLVVADKNVLGVRLLMSRMFGQEGQGQAKSPSLNFIK